MSQPAIEPKILKKMRIITVLTNCGVLIFVFGIFLVAFTFDSNTVVRIIGPVILVTGICILVVSSYLKRSVIRSVMAQRSASDQNARQEPYISDQQHPSMDTSSVDMTPVVIAPPPYFVSQQYSLSQSLPSLQDGSTSSPDAPPEQPVPTSKPPSYEEAMRDQRY